MWAEILFSKKYVHLAFWLNNFDFTTDQIYPYLEAKL